MIYKLVNPSDAWTFEAASDKVAWIVSFHVGRGKTPAKRDGWQASFYMFGGDPAKDYEREFGEPFEGAIIRNAKEVANAFRSFMIRREKSPKKLTGKELEEWNDKHRSSMTDFGTWVNELADAIELKLAEKSQKAEKTT